MKTCTKCKVEKSRSEFSVDRRGASGLQSKCKTCDAAYRVDNRTARGAYDAAYYRANPEKFAYDAAGYKAHPEKQAAKSKRWREAHPEKHAANSSAWWKANPGKANAKVARRKATKLQAAPAWADKAKIDEFYYTADMLGMHTGDPHHVDHVVPLRSKLVCGLHCEFNMQVLTGVDNLKKGNRLWPDMP